MITSLPPDNSFFQNLTDPNSRYSAMQLNYTQVSTYSRQSQDITIYTREGDRVTISSALESQFSYSSMSMLSYESQRSAYQNEVSLRQRSGSFQGEAFQFENSQRFQVAVEGELSEEELADVQKAVRLIQQTMLRFMGQGNANGSMMPGALKNLDSLAGFQGHFEYEKSVTMEKISLSADSYEKAGISGLDEKQDPMSPIRDLIEELAEIIKSAGGKSDQLVKPLEEFFDQFKKDISAKESSNPLELQVLDWIRNGLLKRLGNAAEA